MCDRRQRHALLLVVVPPSTSALVINVFAPSQFNKRKKKGKNSENRSKLSPKDEPY